jgi:hypothetical protein
MAPEISLEKQRPAQYVFSRHVEDALQRIHKQKEAAGAGEKADAA